LKPLLNSLVAKIQATDNRLLLSNLTQNHEMNNNELSHLVFKMNLIFAVIARPSFWPSICGYLQNPLNGRFVLWEKKWRRLRLKLFAESHVYIEVYD
jgi:hypothetical protein